MFPAAAPPPVLTKRDELTAVCLSVCPGWFIMPLLLQDDNYVIDVLDVVMMFQMMYCSGRMILTHRIE